MKYTELSSKDNAIIKQTAALSQGKYRREYGLFAVEGLRLAEEAVAAASPEYCLFTEQFLNTPRGKALLEQASLKGTELYLVKDYLLEAVAYTVKPQGIVCVLPLLQPGLNEDKPQPLYLLCDGIADPGNMGSLLRLAYAVAADGIILLPDCVDIFNPKVVRASMGGIFHVPFINMSDEEACRFLEDGGISLLLADAAGEHSLWEYDFCKPCALLLGNEAKGISAFWRGRKSSGVSIPMPGGAESLNVASSASVLCYEALRQRGK